MFGIIFVSFICVFVSNNDIAFLTASDIAVGFVFDDYEEKLTAVNSSPSFSDFHERTEIMQAVYLLPNDVTSLIKSLCHIASNGTTAIFGFSHSTTTSEITRSIINKLGVPYFEFYWSHAENAATHPNYVINFHPDSATLNEALQDFIEFDDWKSGVVIYDNRSAPQQLQSLLGNLHDSSARVHITRHELPKDEAEYVSILRIIKNKNFKHIILHCTKNTALKVLRQAVELKMTSKEYHYLITAWDADIADWSDFKSMGSVVTFFRLIDRNKEQAHNTIRAINGNDHYKQPDEVVPMTTTSALVLDAVHMLVQTNHLLKLKGMKVTDEPRANCESPEPWNMGEAILDSLKSNEINGLTGLVKFNRNGRRTEFNLDVMQYNFDKIIKIGEWSNHAHNNNNKVTRRLKMATAENESLIMVADSPSRNKKMRITVLLNEPYVMLRHNHEELQDNDKYEGFIIDLLEEISKMLDFSYMLYLPPDNTYGSYNSETKQWSGMIKELINKEADMAVSDLTITSKRQEVVDFSIPFMHTGIGILFRKPKVEFPGLLFFSEPFTTFTWVLILIAFIVFSSLLFIVGRLTPYEWTNPTPNSVQDPNVLTNNFGVRNSIWFIIASLFQQGFNYPPKASSTRLLASVWWFFAFMIICFYIANLVFIVNNPEVVKTPIDDVEDLSLQTKVKYGAIKHGSTASFFEQSHLAVYKDIDRKMKSMDPSPFVNSNKEGVQRVLDGNYAFFMEYTSIEYVVERHCSLVQIGRALDSKGYGIAFPKGSPYRSFVSNAILRLQENGVISFLKHKWWKQRSPGTDHCDDGESVGLTARGGFGLAHLAGVFIIAIVGAVLAFIAAIVEFFWKTRKIPNTERDSASREYFRALAYVFNCRSHKTVPKKSTETQRP